MKPQVAVSYRLPTPPQEFNSLTGFLWSTSLPPIDLDPKFDSIPFPSLALRSSFASRFMLLRTVNSVEVSDIDFPFGHLINSRAEES